MPDKPAAYRSIEGLIQHFELIMPNRGVEAAGGGGLRRRPSRRTANWASTSSPTAAAGRTGPGRGRRRSSTSPCSRYLIEGHQLSDVVAVLGSLNIIAAELDR